MTFDLDLILEDCLERLTSGETTQACLARYPEQAVELKPLLQTAVILEKQSQLRPSATFKSRARAQLYTHMDAHPRTRRRWWNISLSFSRLAIGLTTLILAFALSGTALAQSALPGSAFYPWKLASEQVWRMVSPDPVGVDLSLAERRVDEAVAVSRDAAAQEIAIEEYQRVVTDLGKYQDTAIQSRIQQALVIQQERLKSIGLLPVDQETPIPINVIPLTEIPTPTQDVLPLSKQTLMPTALPTKIKNPVPTTQPSIIQKPTQLPTIIAPLLTKIPDLLP